MGDSAFWPLLSKNTFFLKWAKNQTPGYFQTREQKAPHHQCVGWRQLLNLNLRLDLLQHGNKLNSHCVFNLSVFCLWLIHVHFSFVHRTICVVEWPNLFFICVLSMNLFCPFSGASPDLLLGTGCFGRLAWTNAYLRFSKLLCLFYAHHGAFGYAKTVLSIRWYRMTTVAKPDTRRGVFPFSTPRNDHIPNILAVQYWSGGGRRGVEILFSKPLQNSVVDHHRKLLLWVDSLMGMLFGVLVLVRMWLSGSVILKINHHNYCTLEKGGLRNRNCKLEVRFTHEKRGSPKLPYISGPGFQWWWSQECHAVSLVDKKKETFGASTKLVPCRYNFGQPLKGTIKANMTMAQKNYGGAWTLYYQTLNKKYLACGRENCEWNKRTRQRECKQGTPCPVREIEMEVHRKADSEFWSQLIWKLDSVGPDPPLKICVVQWNSFEGIFESRVPLYLDRNWRNIYVPSGNP